MRQVKLEVAKEAYTNEFGDYRGKYYTEGAIVALPYPSELREALEGSNCLREAITFRICCLQFSLFRSFLIKKELGLIFLLSEVIFVWGALILGKCAAFIMLLYCSSSSIPILTGNAAVWNFLLEEFPEVLVEIPYIRDSGVEEIPHISIVGGIAVLIGSFVQHFWYGRSYS